MWLQLSVASPNIAHSVWERLDGKNRLRFPFISRNKRLGCHGEYDSFTIDDGMENYEPARKIIKMTAGRCCRS